MRVTPFFHILQNRDKTFSQISQGILHLRRHFPIDIAGDEAVLFQFAELPGKGGLRDVSKPPPQFPEFFTGANPFVLSFDKLKTLAELVKKYYSKVQSIGCFARITDITLKTTEQLRELREMGYNGLTIGVEAGDDTGYFTSQNEESPQSL